MHGLMKMLVSRRSQIHYRQARPMDITAMNKDQLDRLMSRGGQIWADCSEMATALFKWVGAGDPNGMGFDGWGNSNSMWGHLDHYFDPSAAGIGALVVYGPEGQHHVSVVCETGGDPLLFSHGSEHGPDLWRYSQERQWQWHPATFLSVGGL